MKAIKLCSQYFTAVGCFAQFYKIISLFTFRKWYSNRSLFEIYQHLSRHNVVGFPGMPNYPDNKGFYRKTACPIDPRVFFFPKMFLPHEHGSLLTKVVMFEIIFSI